MTVKINRPWISSFGFNYVTTDSKLDQIHKMVRNYCVSLDLGCPSAQHVSVIGLNQNVDELNEREKYKEWVKGWKQIYAEVSKLIRRHKLYRRTVRPIQFTELEQTSFHSAKVNITIRQYYGNLSQRHLARLQETAQVLLNTRYLMKLAAAERHRRLRERNGNAVLSNRSDASSSLAGASI